MIELWIGDNIYEVNKSKNDLINKYKDHIVNNMVLGLDNESDISAAIMTIDLFSHSRIFFIKIDNWPTDKFIKSTISAASEINIIIFHLSSTRKTEKTLKSLGLSVKYFPLPNRSDIMKWLEGELRKMDLPSDVKRFIVQNLANINDQQYISHELGKLSNVKNIDLSMAQKLITPIINANIFELLDALMGGNKKRAKSLLIAMNTRGEEQSKFHTMLGWQLSIMIEIKISQSLQDANIIKIAKINPYVASKMATRMKSIPKQRLLDMVNVYINSIITARKNNMDDALLSELLIENI